MSHRFFKASLDVYNEIRSGFDAALGFPNGKADTFLSPEPVINNEGEAVFAILHSTAEWPEVAPLIAELLGSGDVEEITWEEYEAALPDSVL